MESFVYVKTHKRRTFGEVADAKYFSTLHEAAEFWQVPTENQSTHLYTFNNAWGDAISTECHLDFAQHPRCFTGKYDIFSELQGTKVYIGDILIWGKTVGKHAQRL